LQKKYTCKIGQHTGHKAGSCYTYISDKKDSYLILDIVMIGWWSMEIQKNNLNIETLPLTKDFDVTKFKKLKSDNDNLHVPIQIPHVQVRSEVNIINLGSNCPTALPNYLPG
jgi:hypothetical protein